MGRLSVLCASEGTRKPVGAFVGTRAAEPVLGASEATHTSLPGSAASPAWTPEIDSLGARHISEPAPASGPALSGRAPNSIASGSSGASKR